MKASAVLLVLFFAGIGGVLLPGVAFASTESLWSADIPTVLKNTPLATNGETGCSTYRQDVYVEEYGETRSACIDGDERFRIGSYSQNGRYEVAVGFAYSATLHVLQGICTVLCRYSADTDTLITQQLVNQSSWGLVVYKHVSNRIKPVTSPLGTRYVFDADNPDFTIKNSTGRYVATQAFSISDNGQWIVVELRNKGTALIDVATLSLRQITAEGYRYGYGMDPTEALAISNDGKSVAVTGHNAGFHIFDVVPGCGQAMTDELDFLPTTTLCPSTDAGMGSLFPNFNEAQDPRFLGDGHELTVTVNSWVDGNRRVTFLTRGTPIAHQLKLLSLGDSFSSGEGETEGEYYLPGTNQSFDTCHVSTRAYSGVIAQRLQISGVDAKNMACSGARIGDISGSADGYWGQGDRLGVAGLKLSAEDAQTAKQKAVDDFQPGRALQDSFIQRYDPEVITIGVGGNDAGLMGKLGTCAMPGTCEWAQPDRLPDTAAEIRRLYNSLGILFTHIADEAQGSRIFVVGYPDTINPNGVCDPLTDFLINHTERVFIENSIHYLNRIIHAAADKARVQYVDIEDSFEGRRVCDEVFPSAMNGIRSGNAIAPFEKLPMLKIIGAETFHPTPLGHRLVADTFLQEYPSLESDTNSVGSDGVEPSSYWNGRSVTGDQPNRSLYATNFAVKDTLDSKKVVVTVPDGTLQPSSVATIEIHSDLLQIATLAVNEDGGVSSVVSIPSTVDEGFHTLHLLGINRGGEPIDMYQFLTIGQPDDVMGAGVGHLDFRDDNAPKSISNASPWSSPSVPVPAPIVENAVDTEVGVLGAQSMMHSTNREATDSHNKSALHASSLLGTILSRHTLLVGGVGGAIVICALVLCTILYRRRWAKPSS